MEKRRGSFAVWCKPGKLVGLGSPRSSNLPLGAYFYKMRVGTRVILTLIVLIIPRLVVPIPEILVKFDKTVGYLFERIIIKERESHILADIRGVLPP